MIRIYTKQNNEAIKKLLKRPQASANKVEHLVQEIFTAIQQEGNEALRRYTLQFDKVSINEFQVSKAETQNAIKRVPQELKKAMQQAYENIYAFHIAQKEKIKKIKIDKGITCWREARPIEKIGIYIPGGTAPLFSSVLMLGIPAKIATCKEIIITTPPNTKGEIDDAILYAAHLVGITKIFKCGGIQAIASLTFGTETIPAVYKIVGPGNAFVTAAKLESIKYDVAIDMPAGPSELMILADEYANPNWVAADALAQLEHGKDSQVIIIVNQQSSAEKINISIQEQLKNLPRQEIAKVSLLHSKIIIEANFKQQLFIINEYAPEHLVLNCKNDEAYIPEIQNAGSVFLGEYSAEALGDYASGTNHTLPTNANAKAYSGVSLDTFIKKISFQKISKEGIKKIGNTVSLMAENEKLIGHQKSVRIRM